MGLLEEREIVQSQGKPDRMKAELPDLRAVPLELPVHLTDHHAAERLVDEERAGDGQGHDDQERDARIAKPATLTETAA
jgi:hypothetical protein